MKNLYLVLITFLLVSVACDGPKKKELELSSYHTVPKSGYYSVVGKVTNKSTYPIDEFIIKVDFTDNTESNHKFKEEIDVNESFRFTITTYSDSAAISSVCVAKVK